MGAWQALSECVSVCVSVFLCACAFVYRQSFRFSGKGAVSRQHPQDQICIHRHQNWHSSSDQLSVDAVNAYCDDFWVLHADIRMVA